MSRPHILTLQGIFIGLVGLYALMAAYYPMGYIWATYEDLIGEWTQFWLFVLTCLVSTRLVFMKTRYRRTFALLAACTFYVAMEEISWGQRVFGFPTPDFFKQHNLQSEANLHNFVAGPYSTILKTSIAYILAAGLAGFGLVYPLLLRGGWRPAKWLDSKGLAAPPLALAPFFVVAAVLETTPFSFNEAEVAEVLVGFGVACMAMHYSYVTTNDLSPHGSASWGAKASKSLAIRFGVTSALVISIAANTALAIYATPDGRKRIDRRVENGIDKFARRYGKYGQWKTSTALLRKLEALQPTSRATLRKLAESLRHEGDEPAAMACLRKALGFDLTRLEKDPRSASTRRSLIRTYRIMNDTENAQLHAAAAMQIGLERIEEYPSSANAAYSLGRTYSLLGRADEAIEQLERAHQLEPTSKKFKKAYLQAKHNR